MFILAAAGLALTSLEEMRDSGKKEFTNNWEKLCNDFAFPKNTKQIQFCAASNLDENIFACYLGDASIVSLGNFSVDKRPSEIGKLTVDSFVTTDGESGGAADHWHQDWYLTFPDAQSWRPRYIKASTEVGLCSASVNGSDIKSASGRAESGDQRSPTLIGVVSYRPDVDSEQRIFLIVVALLFVPGSALFYVNFRQMQRESGLRHDLGNMLVKLDSNVGKFSPERSASDLRKFSDALKETITNFRLAVKSRRDFTGEPRAVNLRTMLGSLLLSVYADDEADVPEKEVFSFEKDGRQFSVPVTLECRPHDLSVELWPEEMERVFLNLLINATKAASAAGPEGWVHIQAKERFGKVLVTFSNNGDSFDDTVLQNFGKTLLGLRIRTRSGGLGLTVVRRVVSQHRGRVRLRNLEGQGAEVAIMLPTRLWKRNSLKAEFDAELEKSLKWLRWMKWTPFR